MEQVIVGVTHQDHLYPKIIEYIDGAYPSAKSAMLEIAQDWRKYNGFFEDAARHIEGKGARIIVGDLKYWDVFQEGKLESLVSQDEELKQFAQIAGAAIDGRLLKNRNESMNEVFRRETPGLTVIGARHAKYLKQHNPQAKLIYLTSTNLVTRMLGLDISLFADETIRFPQSKEDITYQTLGSLSIASGFAGGAGFLSSGIAVFLAPAAYAAYCTAQSFRTSKQSEMNLKMVSGCGTLVAGLLIGAAATGAGYAVGAALNALM